MRVVVIYRDNADYSRVVDDYIRDFERQTGDRLETMNPDHPNTINFCSVYDIVEYPTIVALTYDGSVINFWRGLPLPTINEVSFYTQPD